MNAKSKHHGNERTGSTDKNSDAAAQGTAAHAYDVASTKVSQALETSGAAVKRTVAGLEGNPLGILVGGLALGAVAGALAPRSTREKELLKPVGQRLAGMAALAIAAAKEAGQAELDQRGLTRDAARNQAKDAFGGLSKALLSAGAAAFRQASGKPDA